MTNSNAVSLAERLRNAHEERDLDQLAPLLAEDVSWGDGNQPRGGRNKAQVLGTFEALMSGGLEADVTELSVGAQGLLCALARRRTQPSAARRRVLRSVWAKGSSMTAILSMVRSS